MTRTVARELSIQIGFSLDYNAEDVEEVLEGFFDKEYYATLAVENDIFAEYPNRKQLDYIKKIVTGTTEHREELDAYIEKYSKGWRISRISRVAISILRTALFEVLYLEDVPESVAINEAVELSKGYVDQETVSFINGILGSFMRGERGRDVLPEREADLPETQDTNNSEALELKGEQTEGK